MHIHPHAVQHDFVFRFGVDGEEVALVDQDAQELARLYPESPLPAYTPKTPTRLADLQALIEQDRERGYGVSMGGYETGISTIAAPVHDDRGVVTAALSISVPSQRIEDDALMPLVDMVRASARQLTERLKHLPTRGHWPQATPKHTA